VHISRIGEAYRKKCTRAISRSFFASLADGLGGAFKYTVCKVGHQRRVGDDTLLQAQVYTYSSMSIERDQCCHHSLDAPSPSFEFCVLRLLYRAVQVA